MMSKVTKVKEYENNQAVLASKMIDRSGYLNRPTFGMIEITMSEWHWNALEFFSVKITNPYSLSKFLKDTEGVISNNPECVEKERSLWELIIKHRIEYYYKSYIDVIHLKKR